MSHRLPYPLPWGHGSVAIFTQHAAERLIVFIHGFGGKAVKTWDGMDDLFEDSRTANADVVFYGYGSLAAPARNSAGLFLQFVDVAAQVAPAWSGALRRAGASPHARAYTDILIVAHSLGAAVARRALLDAIASGHGWVVNTRLLLFGPAHMGTRLTTLKRELRSSIGGIIADFFTLAQVRTPVLDDLAEGSRFLADLLTESRREIAAGWNGPVIAQKVIFGERDYVVLTDPFADDPLSEVWQGEDHSSVCRLPQTPHEVARLL